MATETLKQFAELVKKMRDTQKMYFRNRERVTLIESKTLEKEVDEAIRMILEG